MTHATETSSLASTPAPGNGDGAAVPDATPRPGNGACLSRFEPDRPRPKLTESEKRILRLVCEGLTNAEIAALLGLSPEHVKSELKRLFRKLEVKNRTQAAVLLVKQTLL